MKFKKLSNDGPEVSRIALGGLTLGGASHTDWMMSDQDSSAVLARAVELGINFIDTSDSYTGGASEDFIGRHWRYFARREDLVIATKTGAGTSERPRAGALSRKSIHNAIENSLRRLRTDHVDLYQIHQLDPITPWEETLSALNELVRSGKVRCIGASNILAYQLMKALAISDANGWVRFATVQNQYNLVYREEEREMMPLCRMENVGMIPWSPLARGFLAGTKPKAGKTKTARSAADPRISEYYTNDADFLVLERLRKLADARQLLPTQIALAWLLSHDQVTAPIVGVTRMHHLETAAAAVDIELDEDEIEFLEEPYRPHPVHLHL